jgi:Copper transport outer membrane protein, MctB
VELDASRLVAWDGVFDFRYHVASLAAVFIALVIGILVGVGISGRGLVDKSERKILNRNIEQLQTDLDGAQFRLAQLERQQQATQTLANDAYPALTAGRLNGKSVAVVVVGRDKGPTGAAVDQALRDADAPTASGRYRALKVPIDVAALRAALAGRKPLAAYAGRQKLDALGRALARELVRGGKTPLWDSLQSELVEELGGSSQGPVDGVVVVRAEGPQRGATALFLKGLYSGLASAGVPAVGVDALTAKTPAVAAFGAAGLSTVDDIDSNYGKLALVLLLAGADPGRYGFGQERAPDGLLPPIAPLVPGA